MRSVVCDSHISGIVKSGNSQWHNIFGVSAIGWENVPVTELLNKQKNERSSSNSKWKSFVLCCRDIFSANVSFHETDSLVEEIIAVPDFKVQIRLCLQQKIRVLNIRSCSIWGKSCIHTATLPNIEHQNISRFVPFYSRRRSKYGWIFLSSGWRRITSLRSPAAPAVVTSSPRTTPTWTKQQQCH